MNQNHAPVNNNADDHVEFIVEEQFERPTKFSPDWPPKNRDKPLPNLHVKCAKSNYILFNTFAPLDLH